MAMSQPQVVPAQNTYEWATQLLFSLIDEGLTCRAAAEATVAEVVEQGEVENLAYSVLVLGFMQLVRTRNNRQRVAADAQICTSDPSVPGGVIKRSVAPPPLPTALVVTQQTSSKTKTYEWNLTFNVPGRGSVHVMNLSWEAARYVREWYYFQSQSNARWVRFFDDLLAHKPSDVDDNALISDSLSEDAVKGLVKETAA